MSTTPTTADTSVGKCFREYHQAWDQNDPNGTGTVSEKGWQKVCDAWRFAMPYLTSDPDSIDAFLACVTEGMLLHLIEPAESSKLLYAVQVAIGARRARTEAARAQAKLQTQTKPHPDSASTTICHPEPHTKDPLLPPPTPPPPSAQKEQVAPAAQNPARANSEQLAPPQVAQAAQNLARASSEQLAPPQAGAKVPPPTPLPQNLGVNSPTCDVARDANPPNGKPASNILDTMLEQLYAGRLPREAEHTLAEAAVKAGAKRPPTPSPWTDNQRPCAAS